MTEEEYLKLFNNVEKKDDKEEMKLLKNENYINFENLNETPNYDNLPKLNETPDVSQFNMNENLNDGWDIEVQFETRMNGVKQPSNPYNQQKSLRTIEEKEQNLNEVLREKNQQYLNEQINTEVEDVVSVEMFNNMRMSSMNMLANRLKF
jgi:hypothetical protein